MAYVKCGSCSSAVKMRCSGGPSRPPFITTNPWRDPHWAPHCKQHLNFEKIICSDIGLHATWSKLYTQQFYYFINGWRTLYRFFMSDVRKGILVKIHRTACTSEGWKQNFYLSVMLLLLSLSLSLSLRDTFSWQYELTVIQ